MIAKTLILLCILSVSYAQKVKTIIKLREMSFKTEFNIKSQGVVKSATILWTQSLTHS